MDGQRETLLQETATLFARAARVLDPVRLHVWESMGVTFPQLRILFRVRARPGIDVRGLAQDLGISSSAASQQVDKLVARALLSRVEDPEDRRHVRLTLTPDGEQAAGEISRATRSRVERLLDALSTQDLHTLGGLLDQVVAAAAAEDQPAVSGV